MKKLTYALIAAMALSFTTSASAQWRCGGGWGGGRGGPCCGYNYGWGIGAAAITGLVIGSALAPRPVYYPPPPVYYSPPPVVYTPMYVNPQPRVIVVQPSSNYYGGY